MCVAVNTAKPTPSICSGERRATHRGGADRRSVVTQRTTAPPSRWRPPAMSGARGEAGAGAEEEGEGGGVSYKPIMI